MQLQGVDNLERAGGRGCAKLGTGGWNRSNNYPKPPFGG